MNDNVRPRLRLSADVLLIVAAFLYLASLVLHDRFRQDDFRTYYRASGQFVAGEPLYFAKSDEAPYLYRYLPPVALGFLPFRLFPIEAAAFAWYGINAALVIALRHRLRRWNGPLTPALEVAFFLAIGFTLERELGVGNINLLNLVACLVAFELIAQRREGAAGLALAWAAFAKPQNALLLVPAGWRRGRMLVSFAAAAAILLALPVPFYGVSGTIGLYSDFLRSSAEFRAAFGDTFKYHATTAGLLERILGLAGVEARQHPVSALAGLAVALAVVMFALLRRGADLAARVAMALVPLTAMADYQTFMFAAPLIHGLLRAARVSAWPAGRIAALAAALILFGCNWHDLWGDRLSDRMFDLGIHGLGAWALIGLALWDSSRAAPVREGSP